MNSSCKAFLLGALANLSVAMPAAAYVGPGAGITLIGAVIGLVTAIFLAMFVVLRLQKPDYYKSGLGDAERERIIEWAAPTMIHYGYFAGTALP